MLDEPLELLLNEAARRREHVAQHDDRLVVQKILLHHTSRLHDLDLYRERWYIEKRRLHRIFLRGAVSVWTVAQRSR